MNESLNEEDKYKYIKLTAIALSYPSIIATSAFTLFKLKEKSIISSNVGMIIFTVIVLSILLQLVFYVVKKK